MKIGVRHHNGKAQLYNLPDAQSLDDVRQVVREELPTVRTILILAYSRSPRVEPAEAA